MRENSKFVVVVTTTDTKKESEKLVDSVLEERLAACAQVFEIESHYWWKGKLEKAMEYRIDFKTKSKLARKLMERIKALHSYEVPELIVLPIIDGEKNYLEWIEKETKD
ncbi:MAG: divalent-cation tolerance protein CutA [Brevinematia bacterium]